MTDATQTEPSEVLGHHDEPSDPAARVVDNNGDVWAGHRGRWNSLTRHMQPVPWRFMVNTLSPLRLVSPLPEVVLTYAERAALREALLDGDTSGAAMAEAEHWLQRVEPAVKRIVVDRVTGARRLIRRGPCSCGYVDPENRADHFLGCRYFSSSVYAPAGSASEG